MASLDRELVKWVQSLDLSYTLKNPRRDMSNGFLAAEILSRYEKDLSMHSFDTGLAMSRKLDNWQQIQKVLAKRNCLTVTQSMVDSAIQGKGDGAREILEKLYEHLTSRKLQPNIEKLEQIRDGIDKKTREVLDAPAFARPTAAALMRENNDQTVQRLQGLTRRTNENDIAAANALVLETHQQLQHAHKVKDPDHYKTVKSPRPPHNNGGGGGGTPNSSAMKGRPAWNGSPSDERRNNKLLHNAAAGISTSTNSVSKSRQRLVVAKQLDVKVADESIVQAFAAREAQAREDALRAGFNKEDDLASALSQVVYKVLNAYGLVEEVDHGVEEAPCCDEFEALMGYAVGGADDDEDGENGLDTDGYEGIDAAIFDDDEDDNKNSTGATNNNAKGGDALSQHLQDGDRVASRDYFYKFIELRDRIPDEVKSYIWETLCSEPSSVNSPVTGMMTGAANNRRHQDPNPLLNGGGGSNAAAAAALAGGEVVARNTAKFLLFRPSEAVHLRLLLNFALGHEAAQLTHSDFISSESLQTVVVPHGATSNAGPSQYLQQQQQLHHGLPDATNSAGLEGSGMSSDDDEAHDMSGSGGGFSSSSATTTDATAAAEAHARAARLSFARDVECAFRFLEAIGHQCVANANGSSTTAAATTSSSSASGGAAGGPSSASSSSISGGGATPQDLTRLFGDFIVPLFTTLVTFGTPFVLEWVGRILVAFLPLRSGAELPQGLNIIRERLGIVVNGVGGTHFETNNKGGADNHHTNNGGGRGGRSGSASASMALSEAADEEAQRRKKAAAAALAASAAAAVSAVPHSLAPYAPPPLPTSSALAGADAGGGLILAADGSSVAGSGSSGSGGAPVTTPSASSSPAAVEAAMQQQRLSHQGPAELARALMGGLAQNTEASVSLRAASSPSLVSRFYIVAMNIISHFHYRVGKAAGEGYRFMCKEVCKIAISYGQEAIRFGTSAAVVGGVNAGSSSNNMMSSTAVSVGISMIRRMLLPFDVTAWVYTCAERPLLPQHQAAMMGAVKAVMAPPPPAAATNSANPNSPHNNNNNNAVSPPTTAAAAAQFVASTVATGAGSLLSVPLSAACFTPLPMNPTTTGAGTNNGSSAAAAASNNSNSILSSAVSVPRQILLECAEIESCKIGVDMLTMMDPTAVLGPCTSAATAAKAKNAAAAAAAHQQQQYQQQQQAFTANLSAGGYNIYGLPSSAGGQQNQLNPFGGAPHNPMRGAYGGDEDSQQQQLTYFEALMSMLGDLLGKEAESRAAAANEADEETRELRRQQANKDSGLNDDRGDGDEGNNGGGDDSMAAKLKGKHTAAPPTLPLSTEVRLALLEFIAVFVFRLGQAFTNISATSPAAEAAAAAANGGAGAGGGLMLDDNGNVITNAAAWGGGGNNNNNGMDANDPNAVQFFSTVTGLEVDPETSKKLRRYATTLEPAKRLLERLFMSFAESSGVLQRLTCTLVAPYLCPIEHSEMCDLLVHRLLTLPAKSTNPDPADGWDTNVTDAAKEAGVVGGGGNFFSPSSAFGKKKKSSKASTAAANKAAALQIASFEYDLMLPTGPAATAIPQHLMDGSAVESFYSHNPSRAVASARSRQLAQMGVGVASGPSSAAGGAVNIGLLGNANKAARELLLISGGDGGGANSTAAAAAISAATADERDYLYHQYSMGMPSVARLLKESSVVVGGGLVRTTSAVMTAAIHRLWDPISAATALAMAADNSRFSTWEVLRVLEGIVMWTPNMAGLVEVTDAELSIANTAYTNQLLSNAALLQQQHAQQQQQAQLGQAPGTATSATATTVGGGGFAVVRHGITIPNGNNNAGGGGANGGAPQLLTVNSMANLLSGNYNPLPTSPTPSIPAAPAPLPAANVSSVPTHPMALLLLKSRRIDGSSPDAWRQLLSDTNSNTTVAAQQQQQQMYQQQHQNKNNNNTSGPFTPAVCPSGSGAMALLPHVIDPILAPDTNHHLVVNEPMLLAFSDIADFINKGLLDLAKRARRASVAASAAVGGSAAAAGPAASARPDGIDVNDVYAREVQQRCYRIAEKLYTDLGKSSFDGFEHGPINKYSGAPVSNAAIAAATGSNTSALNSSSKAPSRLADTQRSGMSSNAANDDDDDEDDDDAAAAMLGAARGGANKGGVAVDEAAVLLLKETLMSYVRVDEEALHGYQDEAVDWVSANCCSNA